jgi:hypothetical protein
VNVDVFCDGWMDGRREIWRRHKIWLALSGSVRALMTNLSYVLPHITLIISDGAILSFSFIAIFPPLPPLISSVTVTTIYMNGHPGQLTSNANQGSQ